MRHKISTPGDRAEVKRRIPVVMTILEMIMPLRWNSAVNHIFACHALWHFLAGGPYWVCNMLWAERWHTIFRRLARSRKNVMVSIKNNYITLRSSSDARLTDEISWVTASLASTAPGLAARDEGGDKLERMCEPGGSPTFGHLSLEDAQLVRAHACPKI
jgi:hypothetical protein